MALTDEQVGAIWERLRSIVKDNAKGGYLVRKDGYFPELWPGYNRSCDERRSLLPHIEAGVFPDRLFAERAPHQSEAEFQYVRKNYKQVTLPVFNDLENTVARAMSKGNWSLEFTDATDGEAFKEYVEKGVREWGSVFNFVRFALTRIKIADAMGVIAVLPTEVPVMDTEDGPVIDPEAEIKPDITYFDVERVWGFEYDKWYLLRLYSNSDVQFGNTTKREGIVCWLVDDQNVWRIEQYGRQTDWTFKIELEFPHGVGLAPCIHLMGVPIPHEGRMLWQSPYLAAREVLDIALTDAQYLQVSKVKCVYPHTVMIGNPCDFVDKVHNVACGGTGLLNWFDDKDNARSMTCPGCSGSGKKSRLSPMGELLVAPASSTDMGEGVNANNALAFISPATDTVRFIRDEVSEHLASARKIMHIDSEAPMVGGDAKTATEVGVNVKAREAFVKPITDQEFVIFDFVLECMGKIMYGSEFDGFSLRPPSHYDMRTDADYLAEIAAAIEGKLPPSVIDYMVWQYMGSKYSEEPEALDALESIGKADRLMSMPWEIISAEAATGRVAPWEVLVHYGGMYLYDQLTSTEGQKFLSLEASEKATRIQEYAKELSTSTAPSVQSSAASRLANVVNTTTQKETKVIDINAGNKAPAVSVATDTAVQDTALNGSQVASLVEIINQVALGIITRETANPLIAAAFPGIDDNLVDQMLAGVKSVKAGGQQAAEIK